MLEDYQKLAKLGEKKAEQVANGENINTIVGDNGNSGHTQAPIDLNISEASPQKPPQQQNSQETGNLNELIQGLKNVVTNESHSQDNQKTGQIEIESLP